MRLYPKKLRGIKDIEREKKLLLKETRRIEEEGFLSVGSILDKIPGKGDNASSLLDFLPVSNPMVAVLIKLVQQRFARSKTDATPGREKKKGRNPLKSIAIEVIGGYLKWKAIELSYKGIKHLIKKRREKKASDSTD